MTRQSLFYRKISYVVAILICVFPLYMLGSPSQRKGDDFSSGGLLAQARTKAGMSEAKLGEIDPAGSAMKLATFGMRGVAISLLWNKSQEFEKRSDWDNVVATANQIITLEPHFITIWDFVGWKLAYNASAQFDDYRERYRWVIRGFEFVQRGTTYNREAPKLYVRAGWTISQKIGIADEKKQYRRLFREDDEFASRQADQEIVVTNRDNWLLGHAFYKQAETLYEDRGGFIGKETRLLFFGRAPLNSIRYAEWMERDGCGFNKTNSPIFDEEHSATAWRLAEDEWKAYSNKVVATTIEDKNNPGEFRKTSLNVQKETSAQIKELTQKLVDMLPEGVTRETIVWDRWNNQLNDDERASLYNSILHPFDEHNYNLGEGAFGARTVRKYLDGEFGPQEGWDENWRQKLYDYRLSKVPEDLRELAKRPSIIVFEKDSKNYQAAFSKLNELTSRAGSMLRPTPEAIASYIVDPDKQAEAKDICDEIAAISKEESFSRMFRDIMGADYHEREVAFEQTPEARAARQARQAVRDEFQAARPEESNKQFLLCFDSWMKLLNRPDFEDLKYLPQMQTELLGELEKYVIVLDQLETIFPKEYALQDLLRLDDTVRERLYQLADAKQFIEQELADGKYKEARDDADELMRGWAMYNVNVPYAALAPLPEMTDAAFDAGSMCARAWEALPAAELQTAKANGEFSEYPLKDYYELVLQKGDENYAEIRRLEMERLTDPDKSFDNLAKEIELWTKVVERAPMLKFDATSEITMQIQNSVQEYLTELKKRDLPEPENFPLKAFAEATSTQL